MAVLNFVKSNLECIDVSFGLAPGGEAADGMGCTCLLTTPPPGEETICCKANDGTLIPRGVFGVPGIESSENIRQILKSFLLVYRAGHRPATRCDFNLP